MDDEGQMVEVGTPIISVGSADEAVAAASGSAGASTTADSTMEIDLSNPPAAGGGEGESLVGRMRADRGPLRRPRRGHDSPATAPPDAPPLTAKDALAPRGGH